ncbi:MAG TPA: carboxypeptidase-like regulatory domain-containing protein [Pyrinomonadaceae bacterium]|nr:carboxypeptidase-like regulatory domain-containing protein [Pyrinomonadaceae bacterium]
MSATSFHLRVTRSIARLAGVALILFTLSAFTYAGTVRGRVDRRDGYGRISPAVYVPITLYQEGKGRSAPAYTGKDGMYYLYNVQPGTYSLEIWVSPNRPIVYTIYVSDQSLTDIAPIQI